MTRSSRPRPSSAAGVNSRPGPPVATARRARMPCSSPAGSPVQAGRWHSWRAPRSNRGHRVHRLEKYRDALVQAGAAPGVRGQVRPALPGRCRNHCGVHDPLPARRIAAGGRRGLPGRTLLLTPVAFIPRLFLTAHSALTIKRRCPIVGGTPESPAPTRIKWITPVLPDSSTACIRFYKILSDGIRVNPTLEWKAL